MLTSINIDGYKCLYDTKVTLSELSLLQGENGSGKTAILGVVSALSLLLRGEGEVGDETIFPNHTLSMGRGRSRQTFQIATQLDARSIGYRLEVEHEPSRQQVDIGLEELTVDGETRFKCVKGEAEERSRGNRYRTNTKSSALARIQTPSQDDPIARFLALMEKTTVCGFEASARIEEHSLTEDAHLERDGRNFVAWYRHAAMEHLDQIPTLIRTLGKVVEGLQSLRLKQTGPENRALTVVFGEGKETYEMTFNRISDGEREAIALYAMLHLAGDGDGCLFLDDPIRHMDQRKSQHWLTDLSNTRERSLGQIVLASNHPEVQRRLDNRAIPCGTAR